MIELLENRNLLSVGGEDAEHFLENLITCSVTGLENGSARFGALLTPQGKILFDFFLIKRENDYLIDIPSSLAQDFLKRLTFYRLRAKVDLKSCEEIKVAIYDDVPPDNAEVTIIDPRNAEMPKRAYGNFSTIPAATTYTTSRIAFGVPEGGMDFQYGDAFPHEVLMDKNAGVDFKKGCYVGQEVVSRMQHKSTIRKRIIKIEANQPLPATGTDIMTDGKSSGTIGTVDGNYGLAMMRLDRGEKAEAITADGIEITCKRPNWLDIDWPKEV